jgi:hypothetical protein
MRDDFMSDADITRELAHAAPTDRTMADPLMPAKIAAREVTRRLQKELEAASGGVHVESLICALGALAGYACQVAVSSRPAARTASAHVLAAHTQSSNGHFLGDAIYKVLAESRHSVWKIAANGVEQAGSTSLPDLAEILSHTSMVFGTEAFGVPRMPKQHRAGDSPLNYVRKLWPALKPVVEAACPSPEQWPVVFALGVRDAVIAHRSSFDPSVALRLAMESAAAMTKATLDDSGRAVAATRGEPKNPAPDRASAANAPSIKPQAFRYATSGAKIAAAYVLALAITGTCLEFGYVWLAAISGAIAVFVIVRMHSRARGSQEIVLRSDGVALPTSNSSPRMVSLRYDDIRKIALKSTGARGRLLVTTTKGDCEVLARRFDSEFEFSRFAHTLAGRANVSLATE